MSASPSPLPRSVIVSRLRAAGCVFADDEARLLVSAARTPAELDAMVERRAAGLPLEHVLGWAEFCGLRIAMDPGVFVPRRRTEFLVRQAAAQVRAGQAAVQDRAGQAAVQNRAGRAAGQDRAGQAAVQDRAGRAAGQDRGQAADQVLVRQTAAQDRARHAAGQDRAGQAAARDRAGRAAGQDRAGQATAQVCAGRALVRDRAGQAADQVLARPRAVVVDLCCGSGAVGAALAAALDRVELYAVDIDPAAVRCARRNVAAVGGQVYEGDLYEPLPATLRGRVDILVANAPYVPTEGVGLLPPEAREHEPRVALDGGVDGLDVLRRVTAAAPLWLAPGGHLLVETSERQAPEIVAAAARSGLIPRVTRSVGLNATVVIGTRPALEAEKQAPSRD